MIDLRVDIRGNGDTTSRCRSNHCIPSIEHDQSIFTTKGLLIGFDYYGSAFIRNERHIVVAVIGGQHTLSRGL